MQTAIRDLACIVIVIQVVVVVATSTTARLRKGRLYVQPTPMIQLWMGTMVQILHAFLGIPSIRKRHNRKGLVTHEQVTDRTICTENLAQDISNHTRSFNSTNVQPTRRLLLLLLWLLLLLVRSLL